MADGQTWFDSMELKLNKTYDRDNDSVTEEDMETGLTMYYIISTVFWS